MISTACGAQLSSVIPQSSLFIPIWKGSNIPTERNEEVETEILKWYYSQFEPYQIPKHWKELSDFCNIHNYLGKFADQKFYWIHETAVTDNYIVARAILDRHSQLEIANFFPHMSNIAKEIAISRLSPLQIYSLLKYIPEGGMGRIRINDTSNPIEQECIHFLIKNYPNNIEQIPVDFFSDGMKNEICSSLRNLRFVTFPQSYDNIHMKQYLMSEGLLVFDQKSASLGPKASIYYKNNEYSQCRMKLSDFLRINSVKFRSKKYLSLDLDIDINISVRAAKKIGENLKCLILFLSTSHQRYFTTLSNIVSNLLNDNICQITVTLQTDHPLRDYDPYIHYIIKIIEKFPSFMIKGSFNTIYIHTYSHRYPLAKYNGCGTFESYQQVKADMDIDDDLCLEMYDSS